MKNEKKLIPINYYNNLKELYNILNSGEINGEKFLTRTKEFLNIYENYKEINEFKKFYIDLKKAYINKMSRIEQNFKYSKKIHNILHNPINNINYFPNKNK